MMGTLIFLTGVSVGIIIGIGVCYRAWAKQQAADEPDYSGGA